MRILVTILLTASVLAAQEEPKRFPPDEATLKQIQVKTAELKKAVKILTPPAGAHAQEQSKWADVAVFLKAAEWIQRHHEWLSKDSAKQTLQVLEAGMQRAYAFEDGKTPWRDIRGKPVVRGFLSLDGSIQPYRVTLPKKFGPDNRECRLDILLHGRDATLTEVKFIANAENAKPGKADAIILEPYGRGNNAYRWAGEADVFEAKQDFTNYGFTQDPNVYLPCVKGPVVIRGFSMGGAGTWHLGLHRPAEFKAMAPGAGFTVTRGYVKDLPANLPDYVERCLHIYDAVDYAENLTIIPCVAYSGEIDPQIAAVRNIETKLKGFTDPVRFQHIVGTGLAHKLPPEWWAKVDAELRKHVAADAPKPEKMKFVTHTPRYGGTPFGTITSLEKLYDKTVIEGSLKEGWKATTKNVRTLSVAGVLEEGEEIDLDSQKLTFTRSAHMGTLSKDQGKWQFDPRRRPVLAPVPGAPAKPVAPMLVKRARLQGPIDDAFMEAFSVIKPVTPAWNAEANAIAEARLKEFGHCWDKYFRADLRFADDIQQQRGSGNVILFGDPGSNPGIAVILDKLPLKWTKETLEVNGKSYDARTHLPVMIYPNPLYPTQYVVLNSGHTFGEKDLQGTNALLYPRLGDWAVLKRSPTKDNPNHTEVVDAGLFDVNWQYEKK